MLPATIAAINQHSILEWNLGTPGLLDAEVRVFGPDSPTIEVTGSPFTCTENPSLPGTYQFEVTFTEPGEYLLQWSADGGGETDTQDLHVVEHLTNEPKVNFRITDAETLLPMEGVRAVIMKFNKDSGQHDVKADLVTDSGGYGSVDLPSDEYVLYLAKSGISFSDNNYFFEVDATQIVKPLHVQARYIEIPTLPAQSPTGLVTLSVYLIGPSGQPLRYRDISITSRRPTTYTPAGGVDFVIGEGTIRTQTDTVGQAQISLVPGAYVEITIEGTSLNRRFTVPDTDFNLQAYVGGGNDYFNVVGLPYPQAETP